MCGICGVVRFDGSEVTKNDVTKMMNKIKHRGPDDDGIYLNKNIGLGFVRLSIIDLSINGHQPMSDPSGRYVIIFNGEIYNYIELREKLKNKGYTFRSDTDTEVVLYSFIEYGESFVHELNGMWAFVIFDNHNKSFLISRDRFGIKPFYYYHDQDQFIFASEVSAILSFKKDLAEIDEIRIYNFLMTNRTNYNNSTFYKRIKKLGHGERIILNPNSPEISIKKWYNLSSIRCQGYTDPVEFKNDFIDSIRLQLRSDVPVGIALSGGLDSSTIAASINKYLGHSNFHSFSAVYGEGEIGDETNYIDHFRGFIDNIHFTYPSAESLFNDFDNLIESLQEPTAGSSVYAEYKVMELAKENGVTVLLNGQGADEYLGGYHYLIGYYFKELFLGLQLIKLLTQAKRYHNLHNSHLPMLTALFFLLPANFQNWYFSKRTNYLNPEFSKNIRNVHETDSEIHKLYSANNLREAFLNHFEYKFEHHLAYADKTGMHFSLETRFPFLDHRLVEKSLSTHRELIYQNGITKVLLREGMKDILPEIIRTRIDKVGFETPQDKWFRNSIRFRENFFDMLSSNNFRDLGIFNLKKIQKIISIHMTGQSNFGAEIFKIYNTYLWYQKFIKR